MTLTRFYHYQSLGRRGTPADVDAIMLLLQTDASFSATRLADYALSLVGTLEGRRRIEHYLFHGAELIQRNYAALFFKRRGDEARIRRAVEQGLIDAVQGLSR
mgnify:CR=1 FL=1